ncbi:7-cyano-7-deazaguanine synthase [Streptomyces sp. NBC_01500]|uniref:7-cyano-7-deazaguanine synthase n=1 Tax=Streptomyces sp. NBC_01500 TaxID=2903886 RepID=UPI002250566A|nr:7-cyano-7-deazaguanine synthase [Streptomyces sp. NBC_01500]MCX4550392.1 7-cyano-7-deazaguanine synthase [Streptomyces sp. NBC_01500]
MTGPDGSLWWNAHAKDLPDGPGWTLIGKDTFQETEHRITGRHRLPGPVPDWAEDLFRVARTAFIADKYIRRSHTPDRWTRRIRISIPVTNPDRWSAPAALAHLTGLLQTLTADIWEVAFRPLARHQVEEAFPLTEADHASEVALFSGGLDSLSWAAARARVKDPRPLLLVMFREIGLSRLQRQVYASVKRLSTGRPILLLPMSQTPNGDGSGSRLETSSRTRSLLYVAGAIRAATSHGVTTVHIPENGQLAINPPLTPARSAACSTRSVHPWTLRRLNDLVAAIGGTESGTVHAGYGTVTVTNPLAQLTKGEVCKAARSAGLGPADLEATLSCGKPPMRQRKRQQNGPRVPNCGICFPCLVRRSGLFHANGADHTRYAASPWAEDLPFDRTVDWRALQLWLHDSYGLTDLLADVPLPPGTDLAATLCVLSRGRTELKRMPLLAADEAT